MILSNYPFFQIYFAGEPAKFRVYYRDSSASTSSFKYSEADHNTVHTITGLQLGTTYLLNVKAYNNFGENDVVNNMLKASTSSEYTNFCIIFFPYYIDPLNSLIRRHITLWRTACVYIAGGILTSICCFIWSTKNESIAPFSWISGAWVDLLSILDIVFLSNFQSFFQRVFSIKLHIKLHGVGFDFCFSRKYVRLYSINHYEMITEGSVKSAKLLKLLIILPILAYEALQN